ncbi:MAG TPA: hypothetical protein VF472_12780 [Burkholderiaceae bacterium]
MQTKHCAACGQDFHPHPKSPRQAYCSKPACQRARKRKWQQQKLKSDPDYAENQARAQQAWSSSHGDYWRHYREEHPDYANHNREMQTGRNAKRDGKRIAKMDDCISSKTAPNLHSGLYQIHPVPDSVIAKMDVWTVEIRVLKRLPGRRR